MVQDTWVSPEELLNWAISDLSPKGSALPDSSPANTTNASAGSSKPTQALVSGASWVLGEGFWASPQDVLYPVDMNHDTFVAENYEMFSLPSNAVPSSVEAALESGWARVRFHPGGVEIDLATSCVARFPESRVKAIVEALVAKGNNFTGKTINVGVDEHPGVTLDFEQALSGSWDNTVGLLARGLV